MSFRGRRYETAQRSADERDEESLKDPGEPPSGLFGRLRHHVLTWPSRYVEMRVEARR